MDTDHSFIMRNFKIFSSSLLEITLFLCTAAILYMVSKSSLDLQAFPVSLEEGQCPQKQGHQTRRGRDCERQGGNRQASPWKMLQGSAGSHGSELGSMCFRRVAGRSGSGEDVSQISDFFQLFTNNVERLSEPPDKG